MSDHPTENLVRGWGGRQQVTRTDDDADAGVRLLEGEFARFGEWAEIRSVYEGEFLERIAPGAFDDTLANDLERVKVLFDHGHDPSIGNKPLGTIRRVEATDTGVAYQVALIDTDYNREFIEPAADAGLLGASFRMAVRTDEWVDPTEPSDHNPGRLPERTITDIGLYEFGPVTFPAYAGASASMRSRSDEFLDRMMTDGQFLQRFIERTSPQVASHVLSDATSVGYDKATSSAHGQHSENNGRSRHAAALDIIKLTTRK